MQNDGQMESQGSLTRHHAAGGFTAFSGPFSSLGRWLSFLDVIQRHTPSKRLLATNLHQKDRTGLYDTYNTPVSTLYFSHITK